MKLNLFALCMSLFLVTGISCMVRDKTIEQNKPMEQVSVERFDIDRLPEVALLSDGAEQSLTTELAKPCMLCEGEHGAPIFDRTKVILSDCGHNTFHLWCFLHWQEIYNKSAQEQVPAQYKCPTCTHFIEVSLIDNSRLMQVRKDLENLYELFMSTNGALISTYPNIAQATEYAKKAKEERRYLDAFHYYIAGALQDRTAASKDSYVKAIGVFYTIHDKHDSSLYQKNCIRYCIKLLQIATGAHIEARAPHLASIYNSPLGKIKQAELLNATVLSGDIANAFAFFALDFLHGDPGKPTGGNPYKALFYFKQAHLQQNAYGRMYVEIARIYKRLFALHRRSPHADFYASQVRDYCQKAIDAGSKEAAELLAEFCVVNDMAREVTNSAYKQATDMGSPSATFQLASRFALQQDYDKAIWCYERLLALQTREFDPGLICCLIAELYAKKGELVKTENYYEKALVIHKNVRALISFGNYLRDYKRDFLQAEKQYRTLLIHSKDNNDHGKALEELGNLYHYHMKDLLRAESFYLQHLTDVSFKINSAAFKGLVELYKDSPSPAEWQRDVVKCSFLNSAGYYYAALLIARHNKVEQESLDAIKRCINRYSVTSHEYLQYKAQDFVALAELLKKDMRVLLQEMEVPDAFAHSICAACAPIDLDLD